MKQKAKVVLAALLVLVVLAGMWVCAYYPEDKPEQAAAAPEEDYVTRSTAPVVELRAEAVMPHSELPTPSQEAAEPEPEMVCLGTFRATAYCACEKCCDKAHSDPAYGITASGTVATEGRTIAADPSVLPYGTEIYINGHSYTVEDTGGAIREDRVDIYFDSHEDALVFGVQDVEVWVAGHG